MTHAQPEGIEALIEQTRAPRVTPEQMDVLAAGFEAIDDERALLHATLTRTRARTMHGDFDVDIADVDALQQRFAAIGDLSGQARTIFFGGYVLQMTGRYTEARQWFDRCMEQFRRLDDVFFIAGTHTQLGMLYNTTGNAAAALLEFDRALQGYQQIDERYGIAGTKTNVGTVYHSIQDLDRAYLAYNEALPMHEANHDLKFLASTLNNLGVLHYFRNEFDQAIEHFRRVLDLHAQMHDPVAIIEAKGTLAETYIAAGMYDEARALFMTFNEEDSPDPMFRIDMHVAKARLSVVDNDHIAARDRYQYALALAEAHTLPSRQLDVHRAMRDLAQQQNDLAAYIEHNTRIQELTDRHFGTNTAREVAAFDHQRELDARTQELDQHRSALHATLPKHIAERVVRGESINDQFTEAAVLFIDIVGFTDHTSNMDAAEVIVLLERVFSSFDAICEQHHVTKVKTIGDSYMCFRGDADAATNARSIADVAVAVHTSTFTWPDGSPLQFRAGIHIGPAAAGVIGTQRLQYDVWGDTVNVASRLERTSEPGRIHVSQALADALRSGQHHAPYSLIERGVVDIKGKGAMTTLWLEPR